MDSELQSLAGVMEQTDHRLKAGSHAAPRVWATGFRTLDTCLSGGFRAGELILLAGPQGLGKTTYALQMLRYVACAGRSAVYFSFEHDTQTLLERLVAMEAGMIAGPNGVTLDRVRKSFEGSDGEGAGSLAERLSDTEGGREAVEAIETYAERLLLHRSTGSKTTLDTIREVIEAVSAETQQLPFVVVDYLQKVKLTDGPRDEEERVTVVVEGLKDLAVELDIPVLAVVAADKVGVEAGKRMRTQHMRGSSALAYEADTVLIMNEKYDSVARHHLVYDVGNAERFRDWAVVTIEKNRSGMFGIDLEFRKRFEQSRFEGGGQRIAEQLVDERVYVE